MAGKVLLVVVVMTFLLGFLLGASQNSLRAKAAQLYPPPGDSSPPAASRSARVTCSASNAASKAKLFKERKSDTTRCPHEERWLVAMHQLDPDPRKLFINIGANKGFSFIDLLAIWGREWLASKKVDKVVWRGAIGNSPCGACGQCRGAPYESWTLGEWKGAGDAPMIHAFEPLPGNFEPVAEAIESLGLGDHIKMYPKAFGEKTGTVQFPKCAKSVQGGKNRFEEACGIGNVGTKSKETFPVELETVDHFVESLNLRKGQRVDFLFIDTEGHDSAVIRGAKKTLDAGLVRFLAFEYHKEGLWKTTSLKSVVDSLDEEGFDCFYGGKSGTWRLTGCWSDIYEYKQWSNVVCAMRNDPWWAVLETLDVKLGV